MQISILLFPLLTNALTTTSSIKDDTQIARLMSFESQSTLSCFYESLESGMNLNLAMRPTYDAGYPMQFRLTSPSGDFSEWAGGDGEAKMEYNTTETGDYEICLYTRRPMRINFFIQFYHPEKMQLSFKAFLATKDQGVAMQHSLTTSTQNIYKIYYHLKLSNQLVGRDEALQEKNGDYIKYYSIIFMFTVFLIACFQVFYIRKLFQIDPKKIRI